tara:strand:+ start:228 stop:695 length:468 start_codon:yes stop_codon:yes gene_type:complete
MLPIITNELSKTQIKVIADQTASDIIDNGKDIIQIADTIAKMELFIKELKANPEYLDYLITEVSKFGKGTTTSTGTKLELAEVGVKYDFSQCNDPELKKMEQEFEVLEEKIKCRKDFLKTLSANGIDVMTEEGELITLYPPSKTSKSSVKTTILK